MKYGLTGALVVIFLIMPGLPAAGHHEILAKFDPDQSLTLNGVVTKLDWLNPHVHVFLDVTQGAEVINWAVELAGPIDLEGAGWNQASLSAGDEVTVEGIVARDGSRQVWGESLSLAATGQPVFNTVDSGPVGSSTGDPAPTWPDGQPRLGPRPGESGYWANPSAKSLVEVGVAVDFDDHGLLADVSNAASVAPMQPWALALYEARQEAFLASDPLYLNCLPPAGPRQFQVPYGIQFLEERARGRIFVLHGGGNRNWRLIYTDGREQVGAVTGDDDNPLYFGRSAAQWDGDTLVVDTIGFNERFWFSNGGLPHTDALHLTERFTRTDFDTLEYEVTVDDLGAYTRTWTSESSLQWIPDAETPPFYCQDNRP